MCGLLLINKPSGITSFGAVARVRKLTGEKHVGHTGTLDPMASGVLPVLVGRATKLCDYILCADKSYTARVRLGEATDTLDITGKVTERAEVSVTEKETENALLSFLGETKQVPPMFSAIKKDGVRLYSIAREGKSVKLPPRKINISAIRMESGLDKNNEFSFSCTVSKGTYIRALCRDIGKRLGVPAVLTELIRTKTAGFCIEDCVPLDCLTAENIGDYILPASRAVEGFASVNITAAQAFRFSNGGSLSFERLPQKHYKDGETVRVYFNNEFLGLASADNSAGALKFSCIINSVGKV